MDNSLVATEDGVRRKRISSQCSQAIRQAIAGNGGAKLSDDAMVTTAANHKEEKERMVKYMRSQTTPAAIRKNTQSGEKADGETA